MSRTDKEFTQLYHRHIDMVFRICFLYMKNGADAEDMAQAVFLRLLETGKTFENEEHEKAWLIRISVNLCLNQLRHWWRKTVELDDAGDIAAKDAFEPDETLEKVLSLPPKYKTAIYLHYYEGYPAAEIARLMKMRASTVRGHLLTGRKLLKMQLEDRQPQS